MLNVHSPCEEIKPASAENTDVFYYGMNFETKNELSMINGFKLKPAS